MNLLDIFETDYDFGDDYDIDYKSIAEQLIAQIQSLPEVTTGVSIELYPYQNYYTDDYQPALVLTDLFLDETGTGLGTRLMSKVIDLVKAKDFSIYTDAAGEDSARFYKKLGFEKSNQGHQLVWHPPLPDWVTEQTVDTNDVNARRDTMRRDPVEAGTYVMYRACPQNVIDFSSMDYVTLHKKFAFIHAEHMTATEGEQYHVIKKLVINKDSHPILFNAPNTDEYFYDGPTVKGREIPIPPDLFETPLTPTNEVVLGGSWDDDDMQSSQLDHFDPTTSEHYMDYFASPSDLNTSGPKTIYFVDGDTPFGYASVNFGGTGDDEFATTNMIWIDSTYRRAGYATKYYEFLLEYLGRKIISDNVHSEESYHVWNALVHKYIASINNTIPITSSDEFEDAYSEYDDTIIVHPILRKVPLREGLDSVPTYSPEQLAKRHGVSLTTINKQLHMGINVELEHTTDRSEAREIALDHLREMPDYYSRLADMERSGGVTEAFDSPTGFQILYNTATEVTYQFVFNGVGYTVRFGDQYDGEWNVLFSRSMGSNPYSPSGKSSTHDTMVVYSTVIDIILHFLKTKKSRIEHLTFEGDKDVRLAKVYDAIVPQMAKKYGFTYEIDTGNSDKHKYYLDVTSLTTNGRPMSPYGESITEAFDTATDYSIVQEDENETIYHFAHAGILYEATFVAMDDASSIFDVSYGIRDGFSLDYAPTGNNNTKNTMVVLSTMIDIIKAFLRNHDIVCQLNFEGNKDLRLAKMYDAMLSNLAKQLGFEYDVIQHGNTNVYSMWLDHNTKLGEAKKPWLRVTPEMKRQARGLKTQLIVEMPTSMFLELTTNGHTTPASIKANARDIRDYNRWAKAGDDKDFRSRLNKDKSDDDDDFVWGTIHMPWLTIQLSPDGSEGRVVGHEGRHRIAASMNVGNRTERVALQIRVGEDMFPDVHSGAHAHITDEHLPKVISSQYNKYRKYSTDRWTVIDNNVLRL